jgi:uncharacterized protein HemX
MPGPEESMIDAAPLRAGHTLMMEEASSENSTTEDRSTSHGSIVEAPLAAKETTMVNRSKMLVCLVLFLSAAAVGAATYRFTSKQQEDDFETQVRFRRVWRIKRNQSRLRFLTNINITPLFYSSVRLLCQINP